MFTFRSSALGRGQLSHPPQPRVNAREQRANPSTRSTFFRSHQLLSVSTRVLNIVTHIYFQLLSSCCLTSSRVDFRCGARQLQQQNVIGKTHLHCLIFRFIYTKIYIAAKNIISPLNRRHGRCMTKFINTARQNYCAAKLHFFRFFIARRVKCTSTPILSAGSFENFSDRGANRKNGNNRGDQEASETDTDIQYKAQGRHAHHGRRYGPGGK